MEPRLKLTAPETISRSRGMVVPAKMGEITLEVLPQGAKT